MAELSLILILEICNMSRARDLADSGVVINHLDDATSDIQAQIDAAEAIAVQANAAATTATNSATAMAIALGG
jgi:hypothetical protein